MKKRMEGDYKLTVPVCICYISLLYVWYSVQNG